MTEQKITSTKITITKEVLEIDWHGSLEEREIIEGYKRIARNMIDYPSYRIESYTKITPDGKEIYLEAWVKDE